MIELLLTTFFFNQKNRLEKIRGDEKKKHGWDFHIEYCDYKLKSLLENIRVARAVYLLPRVLGRLAGSKILLFPNPNQTHCTHVDEMKLFLFIIFFYYDSNFISTSL